MNEKVGSQHLSRMAMLYVRQSSPHQVVRNEESRLLQYAMKQRLHDLGWAEVEVVVDDLGQSAAGSAQRCGFERMVTTFENMPIAQAGCEGCGDCVRVCPAGALVFKTGFSDSDSNTAPETAVRRRKMLNDVHKGVRVHKST